MNFVLFRLKSWRLCARNAARSTRLQVATNDTKPPSIVNALAFTFLLVQPF